MRRVSLYSNSPRSRGASPAESSPEPEVTAPAPIGRQPSRVTRLIQRAKLPLAMIAGALLALTVVFLDGTSSGRATRQLTQKDIDDAVLRTLETKSLPSRAAQAYDVIKGSVVRVRGLGAEDSPEKDVEHSVGTGVVILEDGTILTNLHVVAGAQRVGVVFADGLQAVATVIATRPEHDLAVIRATTIPDDLIPATLRSTGDLRPGDEVVAVGFPFGIGPSVSTGVISGLRRDYRSPEGKRLLTNLIQFDAAANPGSSGGPLFTTDGEVVGIVTAILNPGKDPVFIGIGFAVPIENAASAAGVSPF